MGLYLFFRGIHESTISSLVYKKLKNYLESLPARHLAPSLKMSTGHFLNARSDPKPFALQAQLVERCRFDSALFFTLFL